MSTEERVLTPLPRLRRVLPRLRGGESVAAPARHRVSRAAIGPRARRLIRFVARFANPAVLLIAGRRWMPIVGILRHQGRRSGRVYATPLGMRPLGDGFVIPLTFSEDAGWYRNVLAAGSCVVTYGGADHVLVQPEIVDYATAAPAFPRYERLQLRLIGVSEYLRLQHAPANSNRQEENSDGN